MSALVTATFPLTGTELVCDVSTWTDTPETAVADAVAAGARWVRVEYEEAT